MKKTKVHESIDTSTGEFVRIEKSYTINAQRDEEFYFTFLSGMNAMCKLSTPSDLKVLSYLCAKASFNTGKVSMSPNMRKDLARSLKVTKQGLTNSISRLKKERLLAGDRGEYEINPQYFWKGTTDERRSLLKNKKAELILKFNLEDDDRTREK